MAVYTFRVTLVSDINPGGTIRVLRNGTVTVKSAADDSTVGTAQTDQNGSAVFTTTDVPTIYLVSPNGLTSDHITAGSAIENAAAAAINNDAGVASFVSDTGSATRGALDGTYDPLLVGGKGTVRKGVQTVWLEDQAGVATDGVTECGAAIQSAINAAESAGVTLVSKPGRVYVTASTLTFKKSCDTYGSTFAYSGTGTAVVCGDPTNGVTRQHFRIGRVVSTAFTTGWATAGAIGVKVVDANKCRVDIKSVTQFLTGVQMLGHARGCAYNEVHVSELATNKVNMQQTADAAAGFCNQNMVVGGSWNHDQTLSGGTGVAGTKHVLQDSTGGGPVPDTNLFLGCSFEGNVVERMVDSAGKMNTFRDCRWEATTPVVVWQSGSYGNAIRDGYRPDLITITNSGDLDNVVTWPKSGDVATITVVPEDMQAVNGTAARGNVQRQPVFNVNAANSDVLGMNVQVPPNWHTYDVELHIVQDTLSSGSVGWLWRAAWNGDGDTLAVPTGGTSRLVTMAGQKVKKVTTIETGLAVTAGKQLTANLIPSGGTFTGSVGVLSVVLKRRS